MQCNFNFSSKDEIAILHAVSWAPIMSNWESLYVDLKKIKYEIAPKILDSALQVAAQALSCLFFLYLGDAPA